MSKNRLFIRMTVKKVTLHVHINRHLHCYCNSALLQGKMTYFGKQKRRDITLIVSLMFFQHLCQSISICSTRDKYCNYREGVNHFLVLIRYLSTFDGVSHNNCIKEAGMVTANGKYEDLFS